MIKDIICVSIAGLTTDTLNVMEFETIGDPMSLFYDDNNFRKGGTPGGSFVGKQLREMISPENLQIMSLYLSEIDNADVYIQYLASIREVYSACVQRELVDSGDKSSGAKSYFEDKVDNFKAAFDAIHKLTSGSVGDTLKVHVLSCHCLEFVAAHGHTLAHLSDEPIETLHGKFRSFERRSNYRCRKNLIGRYKRIRTKAAIDTWNVKSWNVKLNAKAKEKRLRRRKKSKYF